MIKRIWLFLTLLMLIINTIPIVLDQQQDHMVKAQVWENKYGKLEVYPNTSREIITQKQMWRVTWYKQPMNLDIAFAFNESLSRGKIRRWNNATQEFVTLSHIHREKFGKHFYIFKNLSVQTNKTYWGYWYYDVLPRTSGKWDMYIKLNSDSWTYAYQNNRYIHLDPWWDSDFQNMVQITINNAFIDANLVNFPVMIPLDNSTGKYKGMHKDGKDIRFTNLANDTNFSYEIEQYDKTGTIYCHVKIKDTILAASDYKFNMYYNNSGATDAQNPKKVWDSNYLSVHHMHDANTKITDSTGYNRDSIATGGNPLYQQTGITSYAVTLDGTGDYFDIPENYSIRQTDFTVEMWINSVLWDAGGNKNYILEMRGEMAYYPNWNDKATVSDLDGRYTTGSAQHAYFYENVAEPPSGTWLYLTNTYDNDGNARAFVNATQTDINANTGDLATKTDTNVIGADKDHGANTEFAGHMDEFRISNIVRSDAWIKATFHFINQSTGLLTFSGVILPPPPTCIPTIDIIYPKNHSTWQCPCCITIGINITDCDDTSFNVEILSNYTGSWTVINSELSSVANAVIYYVYLESLTQYSFDYYINCSVEETDLEASNTSGWIKLTTDTYANCNTSNGGGGGGNFSGGIGYVGFSDFYGLAGGGILVGFVALIFAIRRRKRDYYG